VKVLSDDWYLLKKTTFDFRRSNGRWQTLSRETYDRGNGAVILLVNSGKQTLILTRQFRYPAFVNGLSEGMLLEACAGLLDSEDPEETIRREVEEETGFRIGPPQKLFELYMSPGSVTEKLFFFIAEYDNANRVSLGGGDHTEGEDIEIVELSFSQAFSMMNRGAILDAKTLILLQRLAILCDEAHRLPASSNHEPIRPNNQEQLHGPANEQIARPGHVTSKLNAPNGCINV
jgi:nudix-type nucleoside diphosphatase (YffH/AdpP family)